MPSPSSSTHFFLTEGHKHPLRGWYYSRSSNNIVFSSTLFHYNVKEKKSIPRGVEGRTLWNLHVFAILHGFSPGLQFPPVSKDVPVT